MDSGDEIERRIGTWHRPAGRCLNEVEFCRKRQIISFFQNHIYVHETESLAPSKKILEKEIGVCINDNKCRIFDMENFPENPAPDY